MSFTPKQIRVGNRKLLGLADTISRRRRYDQSAYTHIGHTCNTPACAWGTHVYSTPKLLKSVREQVAALVAELRVEDGVYPDLPTRLSLEGDIIAGMVTSGAEREFALGYFERGELFGGYGCGNADTDAKAAANYIRGFVARREKHLVELGYFKRPLKAAA